MHTQQTPTGGMPNPAEPLSQWLALRDLLIAFGYTADDADAVSVKAVKTGKAVVDYPSGITVEYSSAK